VEEKLGSGGSGLVGWVDSMGEREGADSLPLLISCRRARVLSRGPPRPRGVQFVCLAKADGVIMRRVVAYDGVVEEGWYMHNGGNRPR
jgi:hypothetical protein